MNQLSERNEVPLWLQRASRVLARFMEKNSIRSFSSLQTETSLVYNTTRKLDPRHIDPTITFEAVGNIFAQLFHYIKECDGKRLDEDDDFEGVDKEWAKITMEFYGKKKTT